MNLLTRSLSTHQLIRDRILAVEAGLDEETLTNTLEGLTDLHEVVAAVVRSALLDEAMAEGLKGHIAALQERLRRLTERADARRQIARDAMLEVDIRKIAAPDFTVSVRPGSPALVVMDEVRRIRGNRDKDSVILGEGAARCVLARTNATVILEVLAALDAGLKPCVVGGTKELRRLLSDVYELKAGKPALSPEFFGFANWQEVVAFADTEEGESIRMFVQLVEQHGEGKLWAAVKAAQEDEASADVILSTAHKAKGREWDSVRLAPDFASSRLGEHPDAQSEVRLFYVAMTRAKKPLIVDPSLLALYGTDAWKTRESQPRGSPRTPLTRDTSPHDPPRPRPHRPSKRPPEICAADTSAARSGGRGVVPQAPAQPPARPAQVAPLARAGYPLTRQRLPFWRRIARLFKQSGN